MKNIFSKNYSKFIIGLLSGLGTVTCISLSSCGGKKNKHDVDELELYLQEKFRGIEVKDKDKDIQRLLGLCREKDINDPSLINKNLDFKDLLEICGGNRKQSFLYANALDIEIDDEYKDNVSVEFYGNGNVKVGEQILTLNSFDDLKAFVDVLKDKNITEKKGDFSLVLIDGKIKVCGGTEFEITTNFDDFLQTLDSLAQIPELEVKTFTLTLKDGFVYLNDQKCTDDYFKGYAFWCLVRDNHTLFGCNDGKKFEIEKEGGNVKIGDFVSCLEWNNVVDDLNPDAPKLKGNWGNIFTIKGAPNTSVTVKFEIGKYLIGEGEKELSSLENLRQLMTDLKDKDVTIEGVFKVEFVDGGKVRVCGGHVFKVVRDGPDINFEAFLEVLEVLKKQLKYDFKIALTVDTAVKFNGKTIRGYGKLKLCWESIRKHKDLFDFGTKVKVRKGKTNVVLGDGVETDLPNDYVFIGDDVKEEWKDIFVVKATPKPGVTSTSETDVTVKFKRGKYSLNLTEYDLNNLRDIQGLVSRLKGKNVTVEGSFTVNFNKTNGKNVVCNEMGFSIVNGNDFSNLLSYLESLQSLGVFKGSFTLTVSKDEVQINGTAIDKDFAKTKIFWKAIRDHVGLFGDLSTTKLSISFSKQEHLFVEGFLTNVEFEEVKKDIEKWKCIFKKKGK